MVRVGGGERVVMEEDDVVEMSVEMAEVVVVVVVKKMQSLCTVSIGKYRSTPTRYVPTSFVPTPVQYVMYVRVRYGERRLLARATLTSAAAAIVREMKSVLRTDC